MARAETQCLAMDGTRKDERDLQRAVSPTLAAAPYASSVSARAPRLASRDETYTQTTTVSAITGSASGHRSDNSSIVWHGLRL